MDARAPRLPTAVVNRFARAMLAFALAFGLLAGNLPTPAASARAAPAAASVSSDAGPAPASSAAKAKVVVVVGPTEGATGRYIGYAKAIVKQLRSLGAEVTTLYSPKATWKAVKTAATGANMLVYLGHGTGWPNPYRSKTDPKKDNGFGLNVAASPSHNVKKYYGEYYMRQLKLAKGALIIFNHACYTAGSAESGYDKWTSIKPFQRADNYASGFLAAGAAAALATASSPDAFIAALFSRKNRQSLEGAFWSMPSTFKTYLKRRASARSDGATVLQAPRPKTRFYDAITGNLTSTTAAWRATWGK